jgi:hypothetical protein
MAVVAPRDAATCKETLHEMGLELQSIRSVAFCNDAFTFSRSRGFWDNVSCSRSRS